MGWRLITSTIFLSNTVSPVTFYLLIIYSDLFVIIWIFLCFTRINSVRYPGLIRLISWPRSVRVCINLSILHRISFFVWTMVWTADWIYKFPSGFTRNFMLLFRCWLSAVMIWYKRWKHMVGLATVRILATLIFIQNKVRPSHIFR